MIPGGCGCAGAESGLEAAVQALNQTVGLWVVGGGRVVNDVELLAEMRPKSRGELRATIRGDVGGDTKAGDLLMYEGLCAVSGGGRGHGNGLHPAGGLVNDGKEMSVTRRWRQRTHQIDVQVLKACGGDRYGYRRPVHVAMNFGLLAGNTLLAPLCNFMF